jgi:hypothetical protein
MWLRARQLRPEVTIDIIFGCGSKTLHRRQGQAATHGQPHQKE